MPHPALSYGLMNNSLSFMLITLTGFLIITETSGDAATKAHKHPAKKVSNAQAPSEPEVIKAIPVPDEIKPAEPAQTSPAVAEEAEKVIVEKPEKKKAAVSTMTAEELAGFENYSPALQDLVRKALELTTLNLGYQYGSSDPKSGGMDCSGTLYHLMQNSGFKDIPRQSDEMCRWVMRHAVLYRTEDKTSLKDSAFSSLRPGCLLFWTGTTDTINAREIPISHVMLYLGKRRSDGELQAGG